MNILMVNTTDLRGGAARVMSDLVKELRKDGHIVKCLVGYKYSNDEDVEEISVNLFWRFVEKIISKKVRLYFRHLRSFIISNDIDYFDKDELLNHPWFQEADVVHLHNVHGQYFNLNCLPMVAAAKPIVWTLHDMWALTAHCGFCYDCKVWNGGKHFTSGTSHYQPILWDNSKYLFARKQDLFFKSKLFLITPSDWMKEIVTKNPSLSKKSCKIIPNGIDTDVFKKLNKSYCRRLLNIKGKRNVYIFVANKGLDNKQKGGNYLKEIIGKPEYFEDLFLIVGGGSPISAKNVKYLPYISNKSKMTMLYNAADAYLDFSQIESYGLARAEAMACGLKILNLDDFFIEYKAPVFSNEVKDFYKLPGIIKISQMKSEYVKLYTKALSYKK